MRAEFNLIEDGFDKMPTLTANGSKIIAVNAGASGLEAITTTGTGSGVRATSPTLVTPTIGVATATSINKVAITAPATSATLTIADGKTLTCSNTLTFTGTDASSVAFGAGGTILYTNGALGTPVSGTLTNCTGLPISTGVSGLAANVATFLATPSSANLASAVTNETGSGALVFATSPTLVTPTLGVASATSITTTGNAVIGGTLDVTGAVTTAAAINKVAVYDATAQAANIGTTVLYAIPASGWYEVYVEVVVTRAATTSSTMPSTELQWTSVDTSTSQSATWTSTNTGNNLFSWSYQHFPVRAKAGTNLTFITSNYASSGATPMQYAIHIVVVRVFF